MPGRPCTDASTPRFRDHGPDKERTCSLFDLRTRRYQPMAAQDSSDDIRRTWAGSEIGQCGMDGKLRAGCRNRKRRRHGFF